MPNWELWRERPLKSKRTGVYASLNANVKNPMLTIGKLLRDNGFDSELRYALLFDRTTLSVGLRSSEIGRKITVGGSGSHFLPVRAFCQHFGLTKNYEVLGISKDEDIWVLKLQVRERR
jgi:hypothetical protein